MHTLRIPRRFWDDHYERCEDHPGFREEVKATNREATVRLDDEALANLKSDAAYYASPHGPDMIEDGGGLKCSAKATLARLSR